MGKSCYAITEQKTFFQWTAIAMSTVNLDLQMSMRNYDQRVL